MSLIDRVIFNTRERLVSDDLNNMQKRGGRTLNAALCALRGWSVRHPWASPGTSQNIEAGAHRPCDIYNGLRVLCHVAGYLQIEAGVAGFHTPELADVDDFGYTVVEHAGVTDTSLAWVSVSGGSPKWRFVEMRIVDSLVDSQLVDIWDALTKRFTLATRDKRRRATLEFRIREATSALSLPNPDPEWVPLAAFLAYPTSTGFTSCAFYDVRPLVTDRDQLGNRTSTDSAAATSGPSVLWPSVERANYYARTTEGQIFGIAEAWAFGHRAGGRLRNSAPPSSAAALPSTVLDNGGEAIYFTPLAVDNVSPAWTPAVGDMFAVYAVFPGGLPRWVKYSNTGAREPNGTRGLLVTSTLAPFGSYENRTGVVDITVPASTALSGVHPAAAVAYGVVSRASASFVGSFAGSGRRWDCNPVNGYLVNPVSVSGVGGNIQGITSITRGTYANRASKVRLEADFRTRVYNPGTGLTQPTAATPWVLVVRASVHTSDTSLGVFEDILNNHYFELKIPMGAIASEISTGVWVQTIKATFDIPTPCDMLSTTTNKLHLGFEIQGSGAVDVRWYWDVAQALRLVGWDE